MLACPPSFLPVILTVLRLGLSLATATAATTDTNHDHPIYSTSEKSFHLRHRIGKLRNINSFNENNIQRVILDLLKSRDQIFLGLEPKKKGVGRKWKKARLENNTESDVRPASDPIQYNIHGLMTFNPISRIEDFLGEFQRQLRHRKHFLACAEWNYQTNLTDWNSRQLVAEQARFSNWMKTKEKYLRRFGTESLHETLSRQIRMASTVHLISLNLSLSEESSQVQADLIRSYSSAQVCLRHFRKNQTCVSLEPGLVDLMAKSRDHDVLKEAWLKWRHVTGGPMRDRYSHLVTMLNMLSRENGYPDYSQYEIQQAFFETDDLEALQARLWDEVAPLYQQLHAYVRHRLRGVYGNRVIGDDGTLPAHLLGNMWAQNWLEIYNLVIPYPEVNIYDKMDAILSSEPDAVGWMFVMAEDFYKSLGLPGMPASFWTKSMLTKPLDRPVVCNARAFDMFYRGDFRIKMCAKPTFQNLLTIFHEMGHVTYSMAYARQPTVFRTGASLATHEAIGDMAQLSAASPARLEAMGLVTRDGAREKMKEEEEEDEDDEDRGEDAERQEIDEQRDEEKRTINQLMLLALNKVAFLPFGYLVDKWRYGVFRGEVTSSEYNRKWWELRLHYQGVRSPVPRNEQDFDPGSKYHVISNSMFSGYFIAQFQQFQMFSALCRDQEPSRPKWKHADTVNYDDPQVHEQPLHQCDLYGSKKAGDRLKRFLSYGSSIPWKQQLFELTGDVTVTADAMLTYFKPLHQWLKRENSKHGEQIGWDGAKINWME